MILPSTAACITIPSHYPSPSDLVARQFATHGVFVWYFVNSHDSLPIVGRGDISVQYHEDPPPTWQGYPGGYYLHRAFRDLIGAARASTGNSILILEHDVLLAPDFTAGLAEVDLPPDWDCLYLGAMHGLGEGAETEQVGPRLLRINGSVGCQAVLFNRRVYDRLLALPMRVNHDQEIARFIHPQGHSYAVYPAIATEMPNTSTITGKQSGWAGLWESRGRAVDMRPAG